MFFDDKILNPFIGAGALATVIDEFNGDNFDHSGLGFIGGGYIAGMVTGGRPIEMIYTPEGTPAWGAQWKQAAAKNYLRSFSISCHGSCMSHRGNYLDLDPTYRDVHGRPMLRMTFDFTDNEHQHVGLPHRPRRRGGPGDEPARDQDQPAHRARGASCPTRRRTTPAAPSWATSPADSVVNKYLQSWDVPNVFSIGAGAFPQNAGYNPTGTVAALAYHAARAITTRYIKSPGPLA